MTEQERYNKTAQSTLGFYREGWKSLLQNWRVLLIMHGISILLVFIAVGPLSNLVKSAIEKTSFHDAIAGPFSYTLWRDLTNNHGEAAQISFTLLLSFIFPYILWSAFCSGGIAQLIKKHPHKIFLSEFWRGGAIYFFRYLRLGLYVLLGITVLLFVSITLLAKGGLNPMSLESESSVITKFRIVSILFAILLFAIGILKELAKAKIIQDDRKFITYANISAAKASFLPRAILLALINLVFVLLATLLYFGLKKLSGNSLLPVVLAGQLFLAFRLAARYVKQASFYFYDSKTSHGA